MTMVRKKRPPETPPDPQDPVLPTVRLPFPPEPAAVIPVARNARQGQRAQRVLVVDDNVDSALSMAMLLRQTGHETEVVHNGAEATAAALRFNPHAILLDIGLPDVSGLEVARRMREHAQLGSAVIVAVSGYGRENDIAESRAAGIDEHLVKPVDMDRVFELLAKPRGETPPARTSLTVPIQRIEPDDQTHP